MPRSWAAWEASLSEEEGDRDQLLVASRTRTSELPHSYARVLICERVDTTRSRSASIWSNIAPDLRTRALTSLFCPAQTKTQVVSQSVSIEPISIRQ